MAPLRRLNSLRHHAIAHAVDGLHLAGVPLLPIHPTHRFESIVISISRARQETIAVLTDQILVSASNFLTGVLLARSLGPEGYGQYVLCMGTILFLTGIQTALIFSPMMVKNPGRGEGAESYYRVLHRGQLLFALAACGLTLLAGALISVAFPAWGIAPLVLPLAAVALCAGTQEFARRLFLVQRRAVAALANDLTTHGLRLGLLCLLLVTGSTNVDAALWVVAGASAVGTVAAALALRGGACCRLSASAGEIAQEHWTFGKWLLASNIAYWSGTQMTMYLAASLLSLGVVGGMSAALTLTGAANVLFLGMENLIPQRAAHFYQEGGPRALHQYLSRISLVGGLCVLSLMIGAGTWNDRWMSLCFGANYREYGWLIWWWGLYHFIGFFQRPYSTGLRVLNDTRAVYRSTLGGAATAILVSVPAIQLYGALGAMLAVCLVQFITLVLLVQAYRQRVGAPALSSAPRVRGELSGSVPVCSSGPAV
jgi:O-antigen/teichoic acid export membrane protein